MSDLFERVRKGPAWLRRPLRAAWHLWKRAEELLLSPRALPRSPARPARRERVLGIYHFQEHAGFLGDMMEFLEILNVLRVESALEKVDLCYIDDPTNPNRPPSRQRVDASPEFKEMMLSLRELLPAAGDVFHFSSDAAFERFFRENRGRYLCWPRYSAFHSWPSRVNYTRVSDRGLAFPNTYAPLHRFFSEHGPLPTLSCPPARLAWAREFLRRHVAPAVPIAAQIRFNPESPLRNTDIDAWKDFFRRMEARAGVKFILVCRREEILPELRSLKNLVYAKDHGSGVLEDLALVQVSHFSMFPDAGFCTYPWFCGLPSLYFGKQQQEFARLRTQDGGGLPFLSPWQRRRWGEYGADILEREFRSLWDDLAAAGWQNPYR